MNETPTTYSKRRADGTFESFTSIRKRLNPMTTLNDNLHNGKPCSHPGCRNDACRAARRQNHDLTPAETRAINDLRTAARKLAPMFRRNAKDAAAQPLLEAVQFATDCFDEITGQTHKPLIDID